MSLLQPEIINIISAATRYSSDASRYFHIISRNVLPHIHCDWILRKLREVGIFENLVLDSLKTIILQICLDHEALSALSRSIVSNIVRNI